MNQQTHKLVVRMSLGLGTIFIIMLVFSLWGWIMIPEGEKMPVHWDIDGEPDRYGSKFEGLFLIPLILLGVSILFVFIPYLEPRQLHLVHSHKAYLIICLSIMAFMTLIHITVVINGVGYALNVSTIVITCIGLLMIVIGNYLGKIRSNFFMGIRTPWTLSSERSWNKTHRLGGKLFFAFGVLLILGAWILPKVYTFWIVIGGVLLLTVITMIYSYLIWKYDPQRPKLK